MVPPTLRDVYLAMAERLSHPPDAWADAVTVAEGRGEPVMYRRVHHALAAVRSAYLGTGCLTAQGRYYLALPAIPVLEESLQVPRTRGGHHGGG